MRYVCEFVGADGKFNMGKGVVAVDRDYAVKNMSPSGYTEDLTAQRAKGSWVHRQELDNQPKFDGYCGPMWDGTRQNDTVAVLRYETWKTYEALSR